MDSEIKGADGYTIKQGLVCSQINFEIKTLSAAESGNSELVKNGKFNVSTAENVLLDGFAI
jgi:hypothetical protein